MRRLFVTLLLVGAAACESGRGTSPEGTIIRVRLRDDQARPGGRNQVLVTLPTGARLDVRTGVDGTADIRVAGAGIYLVQVIPRAGYLSTAGLSKSVEVAENGTTVVDFLLHQPGWSEPPDGEGFNPPPPETP